MGLSDENRRDVVNYRIERAFIALDQAKKNLEINCLEVTANRLYYAAYYAASALLIAYGIRTKSHEGNISQFGLNFVVSGILSKEYGKFYNNLFQMRLTGDYGDTFGLTEEDVVPKIQPTEDFVNTVTSLAREKLNEPPLQ
jgi:uncharacterized protein (UPF0332 family)